jgi:hypothetical protein
MTDGRTKVPRCDTQLFMLFNSHSNMVTFTQIFLSIPVHLCTCTHLLSVSPDFLFAYVDYMGEYFIAFSIIGDSGFDENDIMGDSFIACFYQVRRSRHLV